MTRRSIARAALARRTVILGLLLALALVALVVLAVFVLPARLIARDLGGPSTGLLKPPELLTATDAIRKTLLQGIGGLLFLATAFFTYQQLKVSREVHTTDQFNKAIDHLGSERMDVRVGAIYALERIARASKDGRERGPVLEILSAYVREHAPIRPQRTRHWWPPALNDADPDPSTIGRLDADVHAALLVLARRSGAAGDPDLILSGTDLRRCYLTAPTVAVARLSRVQLQESVLQIANLENADLTHADLWKADLRWSNLKNADLRHAYLYEANLRNAELNDADLREADLRRADLSGAELAGAKLRGAKTDDRTRWPAGFDARAAQTAYRG
jgi:pentapeptide repeat protein